MLGGVQYLGTYLDPGNVSIADCTDKWYYSGYPGTQLYKGARTAPALDTTTTEISV